MRLSTFYAEAVTLPTQDWIEPVRESCDVVLAKDKAHGIASMATPGGWRAAQASMVAQELDAVVVGAGQAGLSAAYHMKREGVGRCFLLAPSLPFILKTLVFIEKVCRRMALLLRRRL